MTGLDPFGEGLPLWFIVAAGIAFLAVGIIGIVAQIFFT